MLGSVKGKRVMELGAGIGRFTGDLGAQAKSVLALDFMQRLIEENERQHGHMGNITFKAGDACELEADPESFDVVFTNWLLMYLGMQDVQYRRAPAIRCYALVIAKQIVSVLISWCVPTGDDEVSKLMHNMLTWVSSHTSRSVLNDS